jgi:hypothetical protein
MVDGVIWNKQSCFALRLRSDLMHVLRTEASLGPRKDRSAKTPLPFGGASRTTTSVIIEEPTSS